VGTQWYGGAVWSGDVDASWPALRAQLPAGLHVGLAGIPWWTSDIGGFKGGDPADPAFRELLIRWFQFGAFCPLFRLHGLRAQDGIQFDDLAELADPDAPAHALVARVLAAPAKGTAKDDLGRVAPEFDLAGFTGGPNEVWCFGEEAYGIIVELLHLRERLKPYILEQMRVAHERGLPPMRALFLEFPDDPTAWTVGDAFLLGPDLLVAPVLEPGATVRRVYLPEGATWRDAWTGEDLRAGSVHHVAAPLDRIPLFLRDGAELPIRG
jgi:alpha-D-xyloside xylohydrolase